MQNIAIQNQFVIIVQQCSTEINRVILKQGGGGIPHDPTDIQPGNQHQFQIKSEQLNQQKSREHYIGPCRLWKLHPQDSKHPSLSLSVSGVSWIWKIGNHMKSYSKARRSSRSSPPTWNIETVKSLRQYGGLSWLVQAPGMPTNSLLMLESPTSGATTLWTVHILPGMWCFASQFATSPSSLCLEFGCQNDDLMSRI